MQNKTSDFQIEEAGFGHLISKAGRQRMLSQRVGLLLLSITGRSSDGESAQSIEKYIELLNTAFEQFCAAQDEIEELARSAGNQTTLLALFKQNGGYVLNAVNQFKTSVQHIRNDFARTGQFSKESSLDLSEFILMELISVLQSVVDCLENDLDRFVSQKNAESQTSRESVEKAVKQILADAYTSKMIAFNAKIAASRAGEYGSEFSVITDEIAQVSLSISQSSDQILKSVKI